MIQGDQDVDCVYRHVSSECGGGGGAVEVGATLSSSLMGLTSGLLGVFGASLRGLGIGRCTSLGGGRGGVWLFVRAEVRTGKGLVDVIMPTVVGEPVEVPSWRNIDSHFGGPDGGRGALLRSCRNASAD